MKIVTIDILNEKALNLLRELEALNLIKVLQGSPPSGETKLAKKKASTYKGIIPPELGDKMQEHVKQSREEWQHRI